ncbi:hypothetical protein [Micromonospora sp. SH-82]|uniref:hypothetical protein n=1 Tax=Micromonospora sp. SH-82 TaxID=3132938 RepID=UPI003EC011BB
MAVPTTQAAAVPTTRPVVVPATQAAAVPTTRPVVVPALRAAVVPGPPRRPVRRLAAPDTAEGWPVRDRS